MLKDLFPIVREAGSAIMEVYRREVTFETKSDGSPVTEADLAANRILQEGLARIAPDITVISEETPENHHLPPPATFFLVDPLDGTREFLKRDGKGEFTVNIALIENGTPILGVVYAPNLDQLFAGVLGEGAALSTGGKTHIISARKVPDDGATALVSRSHRDAETDKWLSQHKPTHCTTIGSSLKFCLLAMGKADLYPRFFSIMEWDTAAGDAVLRAAGGYVFDENGEPMQYGKPNYRNGSFVATGADGWPN